MLREDKKLKKLLVLQSFCPLFLLIFIKRFEHGELIIRFFRSLIQGDWSVVERAWRNRFLGDVVIMVICVIWIVITVVVARGFTNLQNSGYDHHGEMISIKSEKKDSGVTFLVTFILPLFVDDVSTLGGFLFFIALLIMVIFFLMRSNLFYQNPVLIILHYKIYEFQFVMPYQDVKENKTYIGLSKGSLPFDGAAIKRKYIADDVFIVYND